MFYLFLPFKVLFPLDLILVFFLGGYLFIELAPPKIVTAGLEKLRHVIPGKANPVSNPENESSIPVDPEKRSDPK